MCTKNVVLTKLQNLVLIFVTYVTGLLQFFVNNINSHK